MFTSSQKGAISSAPNSVLTKFVNLLPFVLIRHKHQVKNGHFTHIVPTILPALDPALSLEEAIKQAKTIEIGFTYNVVFELSYVFDFLGYKVIISVKWDRKKGVEAHILIEDDLDAVATTGMRPTKETIKQFFTLHQCVSARAKTNRLDGTHRLGEDCIITINATGKGKAAMSKALSEYHSDGEAVLRNLDRELPPCWASFKRINCIYDVPDNILRLVPNVRVPTGIAITPTEEPHHLNQPHWHRTLHIRIGNYTSSDLVHADPLGNTGDTCKWQMTPPGLIEARSAGVCSVATDNVHSALSVTVSYTFRLPNTVVYAKLHVIIEQGLLGKITAFPTIQLKSLMTDTFLSRLKGTTRTTTTIMNSEQVSKRNMEQLFETEIQNRYACQVTRLDLIKGQLYLALIDSRDLPPLNLIRMQLLRPSALKYASVYETGSIKCLNDHEFRQNLNNVNPAAEYKIGTHQVRIHSITPYPPHVLHDLHAHSAANELKYAIDVLPKVLSTLRDEGETGAADCHYDPIEEEFFGTDLYRELNQSYFNSIHLPSWQSLLSRADVASSKMVTSVNKAGLVEPLGDVTAMQEAATQCACDALHPDAHHHPALEVSCLTSVLYGHVNPVMPSDSHGSVQKQLSLTSGSQSHWQGIHIQQCGILLVWEHGGERFVRVFEPNEVVNFTKEVPGGIRSPDILLNAVRHMNRIKPLDPECIKSPLRGIQGRSALSLNEPSHSDVTFIMKTIVDLMDVIKQPLATIIEWHFRSEYATKSCFTPNHESVNVAWMRDLAELVPSAANGFWPVDFVSENRNVSYKYAGVEQSLHSEPHEENHRSRYRSIAPRGSILDMRAIVEVLRHLIPTFQPILFGPTQDDELRDFHRALQFWFEFLLRSKRIDFQLPHHVRAMKILINGAEAIVRRFSLKHVHQQILSIAMPVIGFLNPEKWSKYRKFDGEETIFNTPINSE